jgi:two-component system, OmpR family, sensor histidine kinase BaeS
VNSGTSSGTSSENAPRRAGRGLASRLLAAQLLVVLTAILTAWLVASAIGPPLFHQHLHRAGISGSIDAAHHAEQAFRSANVLALSMALLAALAPALAVSIYLTRRIGRSVATVSEAATQVAAGRYDVHLPQAGLGGEFDALGAAFTAMADRLASVETTRRRLLADLAHEMRTPVATLEVYLEGLEDGLTTLDADTAVILHAQTRRLARLAEDIAAVSRAEEGRLDLHPERVAAAELMRVATAAAADRYAARRVTLVAGPLAAEAVVRADLDRFGQVLGNLLDNALRHTPPGGTVTTSVRATATEVLFTVADTGEGIPAEHLPHVFERFYRVDTARDRSHGGSGIGLAIVRALVQAHGGTVSASSRGAGQGATFTVALPLAPGGPHSPD